MQIDLVKYYMSLKTFKKELDDLLNTKIPEGDIEVNAKTHQKKNIKDKDSELSRSD